MKHFNIVSKIKTEKNCEKRSGRSSVNDICFNKIKFLKHLPSCKTVNPFQRFYLKYYIVTWVFNVNISKPAAKNIPHAKEKWIDNKTHRFPALCSTISSTGYLYSPPSCQPVLSKTTCVSALSLVYLCLSTQSHNNIN